MLRHFLKISDYSKEEILKILEIAVLLKKYQKEGKQHTYLKGKTLAMLFQKPSNRTRVSFEVAMYQLGGHALNIRPDEINMGVRESIPDVARTLDRYVDLVMIRANAHHDIETFAQYSTVPVINGLSDYSHPCQAMGDILTILEHKKQLDGLKFCYIGDGNNVCRSLIKITQLLGMQMVVSSPEGHDPTADSTEFILERDPAIAAKDADIIYTDVWISMGQEDIRAKKIKDFKKYTITQAILEEAKQDAVFMHCLPAHRGEEMTEEVFEGRHSIVFDQAENRLHIQKAILCYLLGGDQWF